MTSPALRPVTIPGRVVMACTPQAVKLYCHIAQHIAAGNPKPSRAELALAMDFNRTKSVDAYVAELSTVGAITVSRGVGQGARNHYALTA
ncbi:helix-turn-helix DNA binding domain protein [Arthrobacter phage Shrooms]|nr:helix-turn-helix DNA binding domain protein [Arthrobacter phage Shrooms]